MKGSNNEDRVALIARLDDSLKRLLNRFPSVEQQMNRMKFYSATWLQQDEAKSNCEKCLLINQSRANSNLLGELISISCQRESKWKSGKVEEKHFPLCSDMFDVDHGGFEEKPWVIRMRQHLAMNEVMSTWDVCEWLTKIVNEGNFLAIFFDQHFRRFYARQMLTMFSARFAPPTRTGNCFTLYFDIRLTSNTQRSVTDT